MKFDVWVLFKSLPENSSFIKNDKNKWYLTRKLCIFIVISRWNLLTTGNVSEKSCRENHNTHFVFSNIFPKTVPFRRYCVRLWLVRQATAENIIWRLHITRGILKVTDTLSEYKILTAFPQQQWLDENVSMLLLSPYFLQKCANIK
jgi:hypothetical protein